MELNSFGFQSPADTAADDREPLGNIMAGFDDNQVYADAWSSTIARCRESLERNELEDALAVVSSQTFRDGLTSLLQNDHSTESEKADLLFFVVPNLEIYEQFADLFVDLMLNKADVSLMWGLLFLVVKASVRELSLDYPKTLNRINHMVRTVGDKLKYMNATMHTLKRPEQHKRIRDIYMEASKGLVTLWLNIIAVFRVSDPAGLGDSAWDDITNNYRAVESQLQEATDRMARISSLTRSTTHSDNSQPLQTHLLEEAPAASAVSKQSRPIRMLLPVMRNPRFFGRGKQLAAIHSHIAPRPGQDTLLSVALHGIGGVGKTQIALSYVHQHGGEYSAIFWIHAQTLFDLEESFAEAARFLDLESGDQVSTSQTRVVFLDWLQSTDSKWLLVFDNAEDPGLLSQFWPVSGHGSVIITTRRHVFGIHPASSSIPVSSFPGNEGASFAFHLLGISVPSPEDAQSARTLSKTLGGHALALTQAASLILKKNWSMEKYLEMASRHPEKVRDAHSSDLLHAGYTDEVKTVFIMSFHNLSPLASTVLGIISLLAPDAVPESLFWVETIVDLPDHLQFCHDEFQVSEVVDELVSCALVQRDSATNTLSTHRLIQTEFRYYIKEILQDAFVDACQLLYESFPKQVHGRTFRPRFEECASLIQHVYALRSHLQTSAGTTTTATTSCHLSSAIPGLQASTAFCRLMCNAAYYQVEIGSTKELAKTVKAAMQSFHSTGLTHEDPLAFAHICNTAGLEKEMSGDFGGPKSLLDIALKLRSENLPPGHEDIWVVMNNFGNLNLSLQNYSEALRYHLVCKETVAKGVKRNIAMNYHNLGRCYTGLGRYSDAIECFNETKKPSGPTPRFRYFLQTGNLFMSIGNLTDAKDMFRKGHERLKADDMGLSADAATCLYKLAVVALREYHASKCEVTLDATVKHLREAVNMMECWQVADCELARASYMLSVALLYQDAGSTEAVMLRDKAELVRQTLQGDSYLAEAHGEWAYDQMVEHWSR